MRLSVRAAKRGVRMQAISLTLVGQQMGRVIQVSLTRLLDRFSLGVWQWLRSCSVMYSTNLLQIWSTAWNKFKKWYTKIQNFKYEQFFD